MKTTSITVNIINQSIFADRWLPNGAKLWTGWQQMNQQILIRHVDNECRFPIKSFLIVASTDPRFSRKASFWNKVHFMRKTVCFLSLSLSLPLVESRALHVHLGHSKWWISLLLVLKMVVLRIWQFILSLFVTNIGSNNKNKWREMKKKQNYIKCCIDWVSKGF